MKKFIYGLVLSLSLFTTGYSKEYKVVEILSYTAKGDTTLESNPLYTAFLDDDYFIVVDSDCNIIYNFTKNGIKTKNGAEFVTEFISNSKATLNINPEKERVVVSLENLEKKSVIILKNNKL